jgi:hypothetical protein
MLQGLANTNTPPADASGSAFFNPNHAKSSSSLLLDDRQLAELFGIDPRTPAQWRYVGKFKNELPHIKIGRSVRYRRDDAMAFIDSQHSNRVSQKECSRSP